MGKKNWTGKKKEKKEKVKLREGRKSEVRLMGKEKLDGEIEREE